MLSLSRFFLYDSLMASSSSLLQRLGKAYLVPRCSKAIQSLSAIKECRVAPVTHPSELPPGPPVVNKSGSFFLCGFLLSTTIKGSLIDFPLFFSLFSRTMRYPQRVLKLLSTLIGQAEGSMEGCVF